MEIVDAQFLETYNTSKILDKNGNVIWEPTDKRVTVLTYEEIPELYKDALIAVEDADYWESPGVSWKGMFNMVYTTLMNKFVDSSVTPRSSSLSKMYITTKARAMKPLPGRFRKSFWPCRSIRTLQRKRSLPFT